MATYYPSFTNRRDDLSIEDEKPVPYRASSMGEFTGILSGTSLIPPCSDSLQTVNGRLNITTSVVNCQSQGLSLSLGSEIPPDVSLPSLPCQYQAYSDIYQFQPGFTSTISNSKYLKVVQDLLNEVINVQQALRQPDFDKNMSSQLKSSESNESINNLSKISPTERQELQNKKTRLLSMLDEVDRRYRQYYHQMKILVSSFDSAAGCGAAKPYTSLALQTISQHFRCLRDAISNQIQLTQRSLGEHDNSSNNQGSVIPRLRYVDHQLRQQRALQQFGVMRNAWRPQRGLPESSVSSVSTTESKEKMATEMALVKPISKFSTSSPIFSNSRYGKFTTVRMSSTSQSTTKAAAKGGKKAAKTAIKETLLTPRFYTTDFDEMEALFNTEINKNLNQSEFEALLQEFKTDYNQTHFVRNKEFKEAADKIDGPLRQIFVEFLERSCTAEFSGFLLYKELGRRLKKTNPVVAEIFSLMSRDEARHAGFLNKGLSDFNLALDLGFLTKARKYTFFKPKFIFYATYLSEKIGYWRYITIYRHLKENPEYQCYPIFKYFENWCQDENRHGDFFSALLKAQPQFLNDWKAKLWSRFFCLSVYVTMYLNDCQRTAFYEGIGLDTKEFDMHVIIETNRTTARIFPAVLDVENPEFKRRLDKMVEINEQLLAVGETSDIPLVKNLKRIPLIAALASELLATYLMPPIESGSVDFAEFEPQLVY